MPRIRHDVCYRGSPFDLLLSRRNRRDQRTAPQAYTLTRHERHDRFRRDFHSDVGRGDFRIEARPRHQRQPAFADFGRADDWSAMKVDHLIGSDLIACI